MTGYDIMNNIVSVLIVLVLLVGLPLALVKNIGDVVIIDKTSNEQITRVVKTHLVEDCLAQGDLITTEFLNANRGASLQELCSFPFSVHVRVTTSKGEWTLGAGGVAENEIFVRVRDGEDILIGRLRVTV